MENFTPPQPEAPKPPDQKPSNPSKMLLVIGIIVLILALGLTIYLVLQKTGVDTGSRGDDNNSSFTMIPIWIAVLIPIIAAKKKKNQEKELSDKQKRALFIIIALTGLLVLATFFLWGYKG